MRIAVNGKSLGIAQRGGAVRVALNILKHIALQAPQVNIDIFLPAPAEEITALEFPANVRLLLDQQRSYRSGPAKSFWEQWLLPATVRRRGDYDLLLNLTNSAPVLGNPKIPQLLLIHDAGFLRTEWFSRAYSLYVTGLLRAAIARGIHLVTVSETSAQQIQGAFPGIDHIDSIPNGVDLPPAEFSRVDTTRPFILVLGSINPRKNLAGSLQGFHLLQERYGHNIQLLVAGAEKSIFADNAAGAGDNPDVRFLGYIDEDCKWALLNKASALLLPSFLEGFGLPVAEALRLGTPVVVSDIPVFRELFGNIPRFVDPDSPQDIARGLHAALETGKTEALTQAAIAQADRFSWQLAADRYLALAQRIVGSPGTRPGKA
ncbi:MAG: glycosyltransferase family 4 protein [Thiogranum sp.]